MKIRSIDKALVNQAVLALCDIIKNWGNDQKLLYIERIIKNLQNVCSFVKELNYFIVNGGSGKTRTCDPVLIRDVL